ncbi:MAG: phage tail protein [Caldilineaceae bacterium]
MIPRPLSKDPYLSLKFRVEIQGLQVGGFSEVSGLQVEIDVHDYREGGVNEYMHRLAGPAKAATNLVLKRGLMDATLFWNWQQEVVQGVINRKSGSVILLDQAGNEKWRWNFRDAYPVRWSGPELRANTAEIALETLELAHRGLTTQPI